MIRRRLVVATAVVFVAFPVTVSAQDVTSSQVRDLAERALSDEDAFEQLRSVRSVDGRPVDMAAALDTPDRAARDDRLRTLAGSPGGTSVEPNDARGRASRILDGQKFQEAEPPRPFKGLLDRIGDLLDRYFTKPIGRSIEAALEPLGRAFAWLVDHLPGGEVTAWSIVLLLLFVVIALVVWRLARRRARSIVAVSEGVVISRRGEDPKMVEQRATDAEAAGDYAAAIRLRFIAGLLRLDSAGAIRYHPALTAGQVRRKLRTPSFDWIATTFENVAYGDAVPESADVEDTKAAWRDVMADVIERVAA